MSYRTLISDALAGTRFAGADPAGVEAWMRVEHPTLDHLAPRTFRALARECAEVAEAHPDETRALRKIEGL